MPNIEILNVIIIIGISVLVGLFCRGFLFVRKHAKNHKEQYKKLEENRCVGPHEWMNMAIMGEEDRVCKQCCWSQNNNGFVKKFFVDAEIRATEFKEGLSKYKTEQMKKIAADFELTALEVSLIDEKLQDITKDYTLKSIEKSLEDMLGDKDE